MKHLLLAVGKRVQLTNDETVIAPKFHLGWRQFVEDDIHPAAEVWFVVEALPFRDLFQIFGRRDESAFLK